MRRIDFYLQHLVRHNAAGIELRSGQPVTFRFPQGDRRSNTALEHSQLVQLVNESAPPNSLEQIAMGKPVEYAHQGSGIDVLVVAHQEGPESWVVRLTPKAAAAAAPRPAPRAPSSRGTGAGAPGAASPADDVGFERPIGGAMADGPAAPAVNPADPSDADAPPVEQPVKRPREQRSVPPPAIEAVPGEPAINRYLREMARLGASDLHLSSEVEPMVRLHGEIQILEKRPPLTPEELERMLLEIAPERNRVEFEEKSDTDFAHTIEGVARFRANYFRDRKGMGAVFRQIPFEILSVEQIGLPPQVLDLCWLTKGLVVVTGPTGSGKSTTLATLIDFINDNRTDHIITIEDPIEFVHPNKKCLVNQREVGTHTQSFKNALRAALREDPDIVLVGEMRDLETIAIAIETAETGHLVFGTLHTTSAKSTVDRIVDQFPADRQEQIRIMLSESLRGVVAQVLCKKKGGGRAAGYEVMITNPAVSNLIREGKTFQLTSVMQTGRKIGMQTMNDHLFELVKSGKVEPEEAYMKSNDKQTLKDTFQRSNIQLRL